MPATYEPISTTTLGSSASSITFSSIAASWTDLKVVFVGIPLNSTGIYTAIRLNSDTGSNYSYTEIIGNGSAASSSRASNTNTLYLNDAGSSGSMPCMQIIDLFSYAGSTNKTLLCSSNLDANGGGLVLNLVGLWRNTAAITSIEIWKAAGNDFQSGTTATLYGIKNA